MMFRRRLFAQEVRLLALGVAAALAWPVGCSDTYLAELNNTLLGELERLDLMDTCGPGEFEAFIPDCPLDGACFTDACAEHDSCYTTCGTDRTECDDEFRDNLNAICAGVYHLADRAYDDCRYAALTYWLSVSLLGQEAFETAQRLACGATPPPVDPLGACCVFAEPLVCTDAVPQSECRPEGVFVNAISCEEIGSVFGGCPVPDNDFCSAPLMVCEGVTADAGLGRCAGEPQLDAGGGVCDLSAQDCANAGPCLPLEIETFRCTVPTDNRLASTDGPPVIACGTAEPESFQADVWYAVQAPCDATAAVRMCGANTYDAMLAVYVGGEGSCSCPTETDAPTACSDDFCFAFGATSGVDFPVASGQCILLRVGGWSSDNTPMTAQRGQSELDIGFFCGLELKEGRSAGR